MIWSVVSRIDHPTDKSTSSSLHPHVLSPSSFLLPRPSQPLLNSGERLELLGFIHVN